MPKQPAFPGLRDAMKKKQTRRELFLAEMDAVVPWGRLMALMAPHYPKLGPRGDRLPMPLETMLRVYFLQNWYALSDPMAEETLYDSEAMRRFAGIELGDDRIPDETTILNFRHLLERHGLAEEIFADVNAPFSAVANVDARSTEATARHLRSALARLAPGGRLVAITGASFAPDAPAWAETFTRLPGALDQIVQRFGTDLVAEVTGRSRRIVRKGDGHAARLVVESRAGSANLAETAAFMDDQERILIFSDAGGTGRSYHADLGAKNQRLRVHYLLEPG